MRRRVGGRPSGMLNNLAVIERFRISLSSQSKSDYSFFSHVKTEDLESVDVRQLGVLAAAIVTVATSQGVKKGSML
jgi:hypothetical protein